MADISLTVLSNMSLGIAPQDIGREAEHNSAIFKITSQPASLDQYACRAEVQTPKGTTYRLVENGQFSLTNDMTVPGTNYLQLVYSDGVNTTIKTTVAHFTISRSLNAVDESQPGFSDGLAQLQAAAFAKANIVDDNTITFNNIGGQQVDSIAIPRGGGLDETAANVLYLRRDGAQPMAGTIRINGTNRGVIFDSEGLAPAIYSDAALILRRPLGNAEVVIEDNSGTPSTRSPIITQQTGDQRYVQQGTVDERYLQLSGGQMTGNFISRSGGGLTNPAVAIGDNSTGFYKTGSFLICTNGGQGAWQTSPTTGLSVFGPLDMQNNRVSAVADPTNSQDAINVRTFNAAIEGLLTQAMADARYLQLSGGALTGPLSSTGSISATGLTITGNSTFNGPVLLTQTPVLPTDATPKSYVDQFVRSAVVYNLTADVEVPVPAAAPPNDWTTVATVPINITRAVRTNLQVNVSLRMNATSSIAAGLNAISVRVPGEPARRVWYYGNADIEATLYSVVVGPATVNVPVQVRLEATGSQIGTLTVVGTGPDFSQICIQDLGPAPADTEATAQVQAQAA